MYSSARQQKCRSTQRSLVFQDISLVITSGSTSSTSFVRQPALDFKGMITLSQVFRPRGTNLIAQEGAYPPCFIKTGIVFVSLYGVLLEGEMLPRVSLPLNLFVYYDVQSEVLRFVSTIFWFYFLLF
jgi:hypothetical protein